MRDVPVRLRSLEDALPASRAALAGRSVSRRSPGSDRAPHSRAGAAPPSGDRPRSRAAAACARTAACRPGPVTADCALPPGPPRCGLPGPPAGRRPGPAPVGRGCVPPRAGAPRAICGTSASSALARSDCSCGRIAPGRGGGSVKLGGMASGARVVTVNSSGASWTKPRVRLSSSPLQPASAATHRQPARGRSRTSDQGRHDAIFSRTEG